MLGLEPLVKVMESLETKALHVNPKQCSRLRHRLSKCTLCADHCPPHAISWGESLEIDVDKCTGCGICATVCPTGALEASDPTNDALLSQANLGLKDDDRIVFLCPKFRQTSSSSLKAGTFLKIPCLGRIDESLLVGCVSLGAKSVWLLDTLCQKCEYQAGQAVARQTVAAANTILDTFGIPESVFISSKLPGLGKGEEATATPDSSLDPGSDSYSRRDFFRVAAQKAKRTAASSVVGIVDTYLPDDGDKSKKRGAGLPFYLPRKRVLLLHFMRQLGEPVSSTAKLDGLPFCQLKVNNSCTVCKMCAFFCPTSAMRMAEEEGEKTAVTFQLSYCTNCNLCQEICYKKAITTLPETGPGKLISKEADTLFVAKPDNFSRSVGPQELESGTKL